AGVAHEINNPNNFAYVSVHSLIAKHQELHDFIVELAGGDDADKEMVAVFEQKFVDLQELTMMAEEGTGRIKDIVQDLRTFTRLDEAEKKPIHIGDAIQSTVNLVKTTYEQVAFKVDLACNPFIACYPAKLSQVFMNIIVNACHAIESRQEQQPDPQGRIYIITAQSQEFVSITIADNGCGMDEATQQKIFEPFFTTKAMGTGTGLGMAISYGIIQDHDGLVEIQSEVGKGTSIIIRLPLSDEVG
ncbi:MAG: HAMP domain-containing histidine kinase, partial [Psychrosphaera sp.]|nr:HAMP domain-containing histidine kinase [Psychrosphaera sp.]